MKIIYITKENISNDKPGSIATYFLILGKAMARLGHEVHLVAVNETEVCGDGVTDGLFIHRRPFAINNVLGKMFSLFRVEFTLSRIFYAWHAYIEYKKISTKFDIVEVADWQCLGLFFIGKKNVKLVVSTHLSFKIINKLSGNYWRPDNYIASMLEDFVLKMADLIKVASEFTLNEYGIRNKKKSRVIYNPLEYNMWQKARPVIESGPVILFVGRVEKMKGVELLITAFHDYWLLNPNIKLVIVGRATKKYMATIMKNISNFRLDGAIDFVGEINHVALVEYYSMARLVVISSEFETFSYVGQEALACGRPIIISRKAGLAEIVEKYNLGTVLDKSCPTKLREGLERYLVDKKYSAICGERGKKYSKILFSADVIATQTSDFYSSLFTDKAL